MAHKDPKDITFKPGSFPDKFEKAVKPDKHGHSDPLPVEDFEKHGLPQFGNGSGWARDDGSLGKKYKLVKRKNGSGAIISVQTAGWAEPTFNGGIAQEVYDHFIGQKCRILATGRNIEIDHKDGRKHAFKPVSSYDEFQPLSKAANDAKRTHCHRCAQTNIRFDAKQLGYPVSVVEGEIEYRGTCTGCYWFDPVAFNQRIGSQT